MPKKLLLTCLIISTTALIGCTAHKQYKDAQYWQRSSTSDTIYLRGSKAQQMLHRDIARCTSELRELQRLSAIKGSTPPDTSQKARFPRNQTQDLSSWDVPERDSNLLIENGDYYDFESCMDSKGWERTSSVSDEAKDRSAYNHGKAIEETRRQERASYLQRLNDKLSRKAAYSKNSRIQPADKSGEDFDNLND